MMLFALLSIPYEGYFIKFGNIEQAMLYRVPEYITNKTYYIYEDDCVFTISDGNSDKIHSITKYDNGYELPNFNCKVSVYSKNTVKFEDVFASVSISAIYNYTTNKTLYCAELIGYATSDKIKIVDNNKNKFTYLSPEESGFTPNEYHKIFYLFSDEMPDDKYSFKIDNMTFEINRMFFI